MPCCSASEGELPDHRPVLLRAMQKSRGDDHEVNFPLADIQGSHGQLIPGTGVPVQPYETMQDHSLGPAMQYPEIEIAGAPANFP